MFKFADNALGNTKAENLIKAKEMLDALLSVVPSLKAMKVSIDLGQVNTNFDLVLESDFVCAADLQEYIIHPEHQKVGQFIRAVFTDRACVDYEF